MAKNLTSKQYCRDIITPGLQAMHTANAHLPQAQRSVLQAAILKGMMWDQGRTIKVEFLEGTQEQKDWVKKIVTETFTPDLINLKWDFDHGGRGDIRITFDPNGGAWSYIGDPVKNSIPPNEPTLNLSWVDDNYRTDPRSVASGCCGGVVKHEFGHSLGLTHEHARPDYPIAWDWPIVVAALSGPPNYWDEEIIRQQMTSIYNEDQIQGTELDTTSVMMYMFPEEWILPEYRQYYDLPDEPIQHLSELDKKLLKEMYPPDGSSPTVDPDLIDNISETTYYDEDGNQLDLPDGEITAVTQTIDPITGDVLNEDVATLGAASEGGNCRYSTLQIVAIILAALGGLAMFVLLVVWFWKSCGRT